MIKIMFICHGNICRSPMAEFVLKDMVKKRMIADKFYIASSATSTEEIGNGVYPKAAKKLREHGINPVGKTAVQLRRSDYEKYDYLICMDSYNIRNIMRIIGSDDENKVHRLLEYAGREGDISDPWYTDDFDATYKDVVEGCEGLLKKLGF